MAQQELIEKHLELAKKIASQIGYRLNMGEHLDELTAYANEGLVKAARGFDPRYGLPFPAYATRRIRGAVYDGLRTMGWVPRNVYRQIQTAEAALSYLTAGEVRDRPAAPFGSSQDRGDQIEELKQTICNLAVICLVADTAEEERKHWKRRLFTQGEENHSESLILERERATRVRRAVELLNPREREIIQAYYFRDESLAQVGVKLGISRSYAHKLHNRAIDRLRKILNNTTSPLPQAVRIYKGESPRTGLHATSPPPAPARVAMPVKHPGASFIGAPPWNRIGTFASLLCLLKGLWRRLGYLMNTQENHPDRFTNKPFSGAVGLGVFMVTALMLGAGCSSPVTGDLPAQEGEHLVELLSTAGIKAKLGPPEDNPQTPGAGGRSQSHGKVRVTAPPSQVPLARTILGDRGLPKRTPAGLAEAVPSGGLIRNRAVEQARLLRGMSGEIERVFLAIDGIVDARVLLSGSGPAPHTTHGDLLLPQPPPTPSPNPTSLWETSTPHSQGSLGGSVVLICQGTGSNDPESHSGGDRNNPCPITEQQAIHIMAGGISPAGDLPIRVIMLPHRGSFTGNKNKTETGGTTGESTELNNLEKGDKLKRPGLSMGTVTVCSAGASFLLAIVVFWGIFRRPREGPPSPARPPTT